MTSTHLITSNITNAASTSAVVMDKKVVTQEKSKDDSSANNVDATTKPFVGDVLDDEKSGAATGNFVLCSDDGDGEPGGGVLDGAAENGGDVLDAAAETGFDADALDNNKSELDDGLPIEPFSESDDMLPLGHVSVFQRDFKDHPGILAIQPFVIDPRLYTSEPQSNK